MLYYFMSFFSETEDFPGKLSCLQIAGTELLVEKIHVNP
jgi:hypothetical protein